MKIVIAGAGAVGTHLAKLFSREHHDITLIDEDPARLAHLSSNYDMLTLQMSPSSIRSLREAEAGRADIFIAVTPDEARNMMICMLAAKLGAKKTVARVNNAEYLAEENVRYFQSLGVAAMIYPEELVGEEIMASIRRSWVRQSVAVQGGKLLLICVKVRKGAPIVNRPLREVSLPDSPYHIVAIKRRGETIIPHGNDSIRHQDAVYFMTKPDYLEEIKAIAGKDDYPDVENVVFLGGGSTTERALCRMPDFMHAKVFETNEHRIEELDGVVSNSHVMYINGDGRDVDLLIEEGISQAQAFVACTTNSEMNILSCLAAKRAGVRKTVAMVENLDYIQMAESLDIGSILNKKTIAAAYIYQMMLKADVTTVKSLLIANADVAEFVVAEGAKVTRHPVKDLALPATTTLGGMVRNGKAHLINGLTQLQAGDIVVAFCVEGSLKRLEKYFK
ncbi:MAG: Trk system potassium transporter TrkA [Alloprevotella sp.]|nr:Trk system potassium transporter TrkA [Alloprevotella sp.]MDY6297788.1 Trk system potassium transporter TrkA [Alloprevotella sp.]